MDYVVAYGIRGDTVSYRVRYQDTAGNALAADRTYYGNVGDKAVAAYLYMEGYTPQALSVAKTLSADETENVLTFVYVKEETENGAPPSESADAPSAENENALQQTTNGGEENGAAGAEDAPQEAGQENAPAEDGADAQEGNPDDGEQVSLPDEQVPLEQELWIWMMKKRRKPISCWMKRIWKEACRLCCAVERVWPLRRRCWFCFLC